MQEAAWDVQDSLVLGKRGILVVQRRRVRESQLLKHFKDRLSTRNLDHKPLEQKVCLGLGWV